MILLNLQRPVPTKRPYTVIQTCSFQMQLCLSMYDLLVESKFHRVKIMPLWYNNKTDELKGFPKQDLISITSFELNIEVKSIPILLYYW